MDRFFAVTLGFVFGATLYALYPIGYTLPLFVFLTAFALLILSVRKGASVFLVALVVCAASIGMGRAFFVPQNIASSFVPMIGTSQTLEGVVVRDPDVRETSQRVTIEITHNGETTRILAVLPTYPEVSLGEHVRVRGVLQKPEAFDADGGRVFRYDRFLAKDAIFGLLEEASIELVAPRSGAWYGFFGVLADLKHLFARGIETALPEPASALASGILVGGKQGLGTELLDAFTIAGLLQIVVLSGYNVMIVAEGVLSAFRRLPRRIAFSLAALAIILFVLIAGAGSSAIRAGVMAVIALYARATGRTYVALRALVLATSLMLLWNPLLLAYDPGLGLSIVATAGLILGTPFVEKRLQWVRSVFLRDVVATTLAAQIAVLPLLLYQTGNLSIVSVFANVLTTAVIPAAMATSAIAGIIGLIAPIAGPIVGLPAYMLLSYVIWVAETAAALPLAAVTLPAFPFVAVVIAYVALLTYVYRTRVIVCSSVA